MSINLNSDVGSILKDLLDKKNKKSGAANIAAPANKFALYKNTILYSILIACFFVCSIMMMYHFANHSVKPDESEFKNSAEIEDAILKLDSDINLQKSALKKNIEKTKQILPKVTEIGEEKKLFKLISQLAEKNNLKIRRINKEMQSITAADKQQQRKFLESPLSMEIEGKFADFLGFKQDLYNEKPILRIDSEAIQIDKITETNTIVNITVKITDFVTSKKEFEKIISKYEKP